ncbi:FaeA/PapI family transcriptional regulator [Serratia fonticola]
MTLSTLTSRQAAGHVIPPPDTWVKTRQISDALNISIYKARQLLLDLVKLDLVIVSDGPIKNSLRWYPQNNPASVHRLSLL